ncbi:hypothetical protein GCM10023213_20150 [Prosthecobacter algae]|uniref:Uncharacterized protein n=1 Tax=Prosthecobacter algae TaxID=1144682 RepID=A0ABP9P440_9BACT
MPIHIYSEDTSVGKIDQICGDIWNLPEQLHTLEKWLAASQPKLQPGKYVADIGFMIRRGATGGGATIAPEMMRSMADLGMSLYLSEYPGEAEVACED